MGGSPRFHNVNVTGDGGSGSAALAFEPWFIPDAPLSRASLHVRLSAEHDAAVHPDEEAHGLAKVDTIWQARIAENSRLFNGRSELASRVASYGKGRPVTLSKMQAKSWHNSASRNLWCRERSL